MSEALFLLCPQLIGHRDKVLQQLGAIRIGPRLVHLHQVVPGRKAVDSCGKVTHNWTETAAETITDNGIPDLTTDGKRNPNGSQRITCRAVHDSDQTTSDGPSVTAQGLEVVPVSKSADQADSRLRPF